MLYAFYWISYVEYKVFANKTAPNGSLGSSLKMFISRVFGLVVCWAGMEVGGGGVGCRIGALNPGAGKPTWKLGNVLDVLLSKSYGLFAALTSGLVYFLSLALFWFYFFLFFYLDELDESDESELEELLE